MTTSFLASAVQQFESSKSLGNRSFEQLNEEAFHWQYNEESNSIAIIIQHLNGNMLSRWTDFLTTDGEKESRQRDAEFEVTKLCKDELIKRWNEGWDCLLNTLKSLTDEDLAKTIYIRSEAHSVLEAIHRQLTHYPYHVGQIILIAKMMKGDDWQSLSIPKNTSKSYNDEKFSRK